LWQPVSAKQASFPVEITNQKEEKKKKEKELKKKKFPKRRLLKMKLLDIITSPW